MLTLQSVLQPEELQFVLQQRHAGTAVLQALGECVQASHMQPMQKLRIDENITVMQVSPSSSREGTAATASTQQQA
jgi:hypothetical protein